MESGTQEALIAVGNLLDISRKAGVSEVDLGDISPNSLKSGSGYKVCVFLNLLADNALRISHKEWVPFVYEENEGGENVLEEIMSGDDIAGGNKDGLNSGAGARNRMGIHSDARESETPCIDPVLWREETARVESPLRSTMAEKLKGIRTFISVDSMKKGWRGVQDFFDSR